MTASRYALIFALVFLPASPFATTFPVTKTADTNDGTCDPDCSLREAIDAANTNPGADNVPVPAGTYLLTLGQLVVWDDVNIAGAGQTTTIIDGNASDRVFGIEATSGVVEISGVTIQNGYASNGGGIRDYSWDFTLTNSTVSNNAASGNGGGISGPFLTLTNSTVSNNAASGNGGGIFGYEPTLTNSTVSGNTAQHGGGIFAAYLEVTNSTVSGNTAGGSGGGIYAYYGNLGVTNSTVSGNTAGGYGGGICAWELSDSTLTNSTVSGNTAAQGGGVYQPWSVFYPAEFALTNTIVADNSVDNCGGEAFSFGYSLTDDDSCFMGAAGDLVVADAMLGPLQDNGGPTETHALLAGSPAIDAGSPACPPPATDQRGVARPQGTDCDIGAVEYVPEPHHAATLIAGSALLALLYRRRTRGLEVTVYSGQF
jgi:CSLREA domain-containing protein